MAEDVFMAINGDALYNKSKVYISRALSRKSTGELDEYQLWASLALELLGKAALASKHPSLIVHPNHWQSMFVASGINITTDVKTITATTLFERLSHFIRRFDKTIQKFCDDISARRNSELHSAELPFQAMRLEAWETRYWHACDTILRHMGFSLEQWLGAADAKAPLELLHEAAKALDAAVKHRIEASSEWFVALKKNERERLAGEAESREPQHQNALFKGSYDWIWNAICPACKCRSFMTGDQTAEDICEEYDEGTVWEIVNREFIGEEFYCPTCELALTGSDEISASGLSYIHEDQQEREMEYEPDYGND